MGNNRWQKRIYSILDSMPLGIVIKDVKDNFRYLYCNPRFYELHGAHDLAENMVGRTDKEIYTTEEQERYHRDDLATLTYGKCLFLGSFEAHDKNGTIINTHKIPLYDEKGEPDLIIGIMEDVSENEKMKDELYQTRKMEAMGILAGGMAHDFNNMLAGIMGYADLVMNSLDDDDPNREYMRIILATSQQAASLSNTLLSFSRKQKFLINEINPEDVIDEAVRILSRTIDKKVRLKKEMSSPVPSIKGEHSQVLNILLNLGFNANDAIPNGGFIEIKACKVELGEREMRYLKLPHKNYVCISVTDTGTGIPPEIREKVFDPFFSTKETGKGTGLGLSTVYNTMNKMGGAVELISEEGEGTRFNLYFSPWED